MSRFLNRLSESFSSTWRLLSDTTNFLSRVKLLAQYERDLKDMRDRLYRYRTSPEVQRQVRERVVQLRRSLRAQGYDLRMGSLDITLEGFRHDDAMGEGFRRLVIAAGDQEVLAVAGDSNHQELAREMEQVLRREKVRRDYRLHYLWYRLRNGVLVLSGSASETRQSFEELKRYFEAHKELLLKKLSRL